MGFNTWNTFGENINEALIIETADAMVSLGLHDAGYEYIVIDDCWSAKQRDANGDLVADPVKFPHGIKYLADYIHSKGLKMGIYSCCGPLTCAGYPGSLDHEYQDAKLFASWGIDFLKYDFCYHPRNLEGWTLYNRMRMALDASGRDILFSVCNWGEEDTYSWVRAVGGDMYRSTGDISDNFDIVKIIFNEQKNNMCLSGPSCYYDLDMLICGMYGKGNVSETGGCTDNEYRTHFALWCMLSAPLMLGCDIRNMSEETFRTVTNRELIAIDQDPEVRPPIISCSLNGDDSPVMMKHLSNGEYAFSLSNLTGSKSDYIGFWLPNIGLSVNDGYGFHLYDTDTGEDLGIFTDIVTCPGIESHTTKVLRGKLVKLK